MVSKEQFITDMLKARKSKIAKEQRKKIDVDAFLIGNSNGRYDKWSYHSKSMR